MIRRQVLSGIALTGLGAIAGRVTGASPPFRARIASIEARTGGRLGVAILDTQSGRLIAYRGDERFPCCSVLKLPAVAFVLARVDSGEEHLDRLVHYSKADLVDYSPVTERHAGTGTTVAALCQAAVTVSDNTAQNLILGSFGGPAALTAFLRSMGDEVTRSDRSEPDLNVVPVGDIRDTTSPVAMARFMRRVLTTGALSRASSDQLAAWLRTTTTGDKRLRAAAPPAWWVGDKTGTGPAPRNATNDAAVFRRPDRGPVIVTAFCVDSSAPLAVREAALSEVGRLATAI